MKPEDSEAPRPSRLTKAQFWHYYERYPYLLAKVALWAAAIGAVYWLFWNAQAVLFPVLVSLLVAYLLDPAVDWLEAKIDRVKVLRKAEASRTMAISAYMLVILALTVAFLLILYPALARQTTNLVRKAPELASLAQNNLLPWLENTFDYQVPTSVAEALDEYGGAVKEQLPEVLKRVSKMTGDVLSQTGAVVISLLYVVMIPIFTFFFLRDFDIFKDRMKKFVPVSRREFYLDRIALMDRVVGAWFRGQVTVAMILAVLYSIGLAIVFGIAGVGVGTGIAIGVLSGMLNIVPYFGFLIGFILSMLMVLLDWGGLGPIVGVVLVFAVVQGLEGWWITPKIVGDEVGLSPVAAIIVLLLGGELFGILGVLLALPVAGVLNALLPDLVSHYKQTPFYSGNYGADVAASEAAHGIFDVTGSGLSEETDGTIDPDDKPEEPGVKVDPASLKRPVTGERATVTDRPESGPSPLDIGTDGDATEEGESAQEDVSPASPEKVRLPPPPRPRSDDDDNGD